MCIALHRMSRRAAISGEEKI
jgi:hypothetical protein